MGIMPKIKENGVTTWYVQGHYVWLEWQLRKFKSIEDSWDYLRIMLTDKQSASDKALVTVNMNARTTGNSTEIIGRLPRGF